MVETAIGTDDPETIVSVIEVAKRTVPDSADEIDRLATAYYAGIVEKKAAEAREAQDRVATASAKWKGSVELGGSRTTGNSRVLDVHGGFNLERGGPRWSHKFSGSAVYQETGERSSARRAIVAYQPRVRLGPSFYSFGIGQYEHDRFLGYRHRYTTGLGIGVTAANRPDLQVSFDAGPATRITEFYQMPTESRVAARSSFSLKWLASSRLTFTQNTALYLQKGDTNARASTGVETRLFGPLKGRMSYDLQYEADAPAGRTNLDTTSRIGLAYSF